MQLNPDGSNYDEFINALSVDARNILKQLEGAVLDCIDYEQLAEFLKRAERVGLTFDYYLDAEPFDFKIIKPKND